MRKLINRILFRNQHVCPWYICFTFDNWFRRLFQKPELIVKDIVHRSDTVLDIGPGQGFFTIPLAHIVGNNGKVIAIDVQAKMLERLGNRVKKEKLEKIVECRLVNNTEWGYSNSIDFAIAFWMVHEVPEKQKFFTAIFKSLKKGGRFLIAEPILHVSRKSFEESVVMCEKVGFSRIYFGKIAFSKTVLFEKQM
jgi:SAM-dependent methyltransferase